MLKEGIQKQKGYILGDSLYRKCPEEASLQRQKAEPCCQDQDWAQESTVNREVGGGRVGWGDLGDKNVDCGDVFLSI